MSSSKKKAEPIIMALPFYGSQANPELIGVNSFHIPLSIGVRKVESGTVVQFQKQICEAVFRG